ncbi:MAG: hypothetical protein JSR82_12715 [Verrucomicrobia bacterium]|nr:hypothetical protein [Verrucomicrobiota bacterium]
MSLDSPAEAEVVARRPANGAAYAVLALPDFALQCALRALPERVDPDTALYALSDDEDDQVLALTAAAARRGVEAGMRTPQALARCAELSFLHRSGPQEAVVSEALLQAAATVTPFFEATTPGVVTLDLTHRPAAAGAADWASALVAQLAALGLQARLGQAAHPDLARRAAEQRADLWSVPEAAQVPALPEILAGWGIGTAEEFLALDRQEIGLRLGPAGLAVWDALAGRQPRALRYVPAPEVYREISEWEHGIETLEPLLFVLRRQLEQLSARVRASWRLIRSLHLRLRLERGVGPERTLTLAAPSAEVDLLFRVAHGWLDTVRTEAPLRACEIEAEPAAPQDLQPGLFEPALRDPHSFHETLSRLAALAGDDCVGVPQRPETHRPNRFVLEPPRFFEEDRDGRRPLLPAETRFSCGLALRRLRPPVAAEVSIEAQVLREVRSRPEHSGWIRQSCGPWRLSGDWWEHGRTWGWEEWDIELANGTLLRLAAWQDQWWVIGEYD